MAGAILPCASAARARHWMRWPLRRSFNAEDARVLGESYDRLRTIEHRLQMVDDRQTHALPDTPEKLDNVAHLHGLADGAALVENVREICERVAARYDELLGRGRGADPHQRCRASRISRPCLRSARSTGADRCGRCDRTRLTSLSAPSATICWRRWRARPIPITPCRAGRRCCHACPRPSTCSACSNSAPACWTGCCASSRWRRPLADELARRPELLDALIDPNALDLPGSVETLAERMRASEESDTRIAARPAAAGGGGGAFRAGRADDRMPPRSAGHRRRAVPRRRSRRADRRRRCDRRFSRKARDASPAASW